MKTMHSRIVVETKRSELAVIMRIVQMISLLDGSRFSSPGSHFFEWKMIGGQAATKLHYLTKNENCSYFKIPVDYSCIVHLSSLAILILFIIAVIVIPIQQPLLKQVKKKVFHGF